VRIIGFPWSFSETPASVKREAPELGQHTEEILLDLGYTWEDITNLKDEEVIKCYLLLYREIVIVS